MLRTEGPRLGVSERPWQPSPAWGGHHQPQCGRAHTLPESTLRPCPRAAGRPGPPLSTPRLKVAVVERKRGEWGQDLGCQGTRKQGVENFSGGAGRPQKWHCASPRLHGPSTSATVPSDFPYTAQIQRSSKNCQTHIHRSSSPKHKAFVGMEPWVGIWLHAHKVSLLFKKKKKPFKLIPWELWSSNSSSRERGGLLRWASSDPPTGPLRPRGSVAGDLMHCTMAGPQGRLNK